MPLIRKFAVQGHPVPKVIGAQGPFPPELYYQPKGETDFDYGDSLHVGLDDVKFYKCKECHTVLESNELRDHICEDFK